MEQSKETIQKRKQELSELGMPRQALHAYRISFTHPVTKKKMKFTAPLPQDMQKYCLFK